MAIIEVKEEENRDNGIQDLYKRIRVAQERTFNTGAKRDSNENKPLIHNLLGYTRQRFGYHMSLGARKYGDKNWLKGLPTECYLESVDRHLASYMEGDRSEDHLSAIIFGIQGCMINEKNNGLQSNYYFNQPLENEINK